MAVSAGFLEFVMEGLAPIPGLRSRRMFGGVGIFQDQAMFALIAEDQIYFKTDEVNRATFEAAGLGPFVYMTREDGSEGRINYYEAPGEALDDMEILVEWARLGLDAALRAAAAKKPKKKRIVTPDLIRGPLKTLAVQDRAIDSGSSPE
jgi:DNA transformation protein